MQRKIKFVVLACILIAWLFFMWRLSSADGTQTLQDSMRIANKIGKWLFDSPSQAQLSHLNMILRKMAHIFLYMVLGLIFAMFWDLLFERFSIWKRTIPSLACCTGIAFLDELQKIPIDGRHFSSSESVLNAVSAAAIILLYFIFIWIINLHKKKLSS